MTRSVPLALASLVLLAGTVYAAPRPERLRGTIESVDAGSVTIRTRDGKSETVSIGGTRLVSVVPSSLDAVKDGAFIGTATKGENPMTALEVVVFPESMRGTAEGHYGWDTIPDTLAGGTAVESAMTNGTVRAGPPVVESAMTNGTVAGSAGAGGEKTLTVTFGKEGSKTIVIPRQAPIVAFEPADAAILKPGSKVFAVGTRDGSTFQARMVAVGKDGLTPPM
jgi:hypothetical protein